MQFTIGSEAGANIDEKNKMNKMRNILFCRFQEGITRSKHINKDIMLTKTNLENPSSIKKFLALKEVYIKTLEELIYNGKEYIQLSIDEDEQIRVAIDLDKYESILRRIN